MDRMFPESGLRVSFIIEFVKQHIVACTFPFTIIALLALTKVVSVPHLPRYDLLFILCLGVQFLLVKLKLETWRDAAVVAVFHILGLALEIYKVNQGSWSYPEFSYLTIYGAPIYSGFMHGSVASFMCLAWRLFDLKSSGWPKSSSTWMIAALTYSLFFLPQASSSLRLVTLVLVLTFFAHVQVHYTVNKVRYRMPMSLAFVLIGFKIWSAENLATYLGAWSYPYQLQGWQPVHATKIVSWSLLMIVSLIIVAEYKRYLGLLHEKESRIPANPALDVV